MAVWVVFFTLRYLKQLTFWQLAVTGLGQAVLLQSGSHVRLKHCSLSHASKSHVAITLEQHSLAQPCNGKLPKSQQGWKNAKAGVPRAKTGIMRRVSMAILKANARHVLRGLEIVVPKAMHTARRARSEAARQADFDEFRHDVRANGCRARLSIK